MSGLLTVQPSHFCPVTTVTIYTNWTYHACVTVVTGTTLEGSAVRLLQLGMGVSAQTPRNTYSFHKIYLDVTGVT